MIRFRGRASHKPPPEVFDSNMVIISLISYKNLRMKAAWLYGSLLPLAFASCTRDLRGERLKARQAELLGK